MKLDPEARLSLMLSEAAVGHIRYDQKTDDPGLPLGVCHGCIYDIELQCLRNGNFGRWTPAKHGRAATPDEVAKHLTT